MTCQRCRAEHRPPVPRFDAKAIDHEDIRKLNAALNDELVWVDWLYAAAECGGSAMTLLTAFADRIRQRDGRGGG